MEVLEKGEPEAILPTDPVTRVLDVVLSATGLLVGLPLAAAAAAAIRLEDGGPVFFSQARVGRGGEVFTARKFRTLRPEHGEEPGHGPPSARHVTRVGRVLRATALDELPQLWTILRGEMSFVGPRPLAAEEIARDREDFDLRALPGFPERHRVRPGLTGIAQLRTRRLAGPVTYRRQFRYDRFYVRHRWWGLDLRLVLESLWISVRAGWGGGE